MIAHKGIVKEVRENSVLVSIISESACTACRSKSSCMIADSVEKEVEVLTSEKNYLPGKEVNVFLKESMGFKAVFLAYLLPFIVLITLLVIGTEISGKESTGGLISLLSVGIYYITLFFFRKNLKKVINFELEETRNQ